MAKKGSITIQGGIAITNAYLRLGGISGGKQSGYWQADIQIFTDGGVAAQAYEQALTAYNTAQAAYAAAQVQYATEVAAYPAALAASKAAGTVAPAVPVLPVPSIDPDAVPSTAAMDAIRAPGHLPLLRAAWDANTPPYTALYAAMNAVYPNLMDV